MIVVDLLYDVHDGGGVRCRQERARQLCVSVAEPFCADRKARQPMGHLMGVAGWVNAHG